MRGTIQTSNTTRTATGNPGRLSRYWLIVCVLCLSAPVWTQSHARDSGHKADAAQEQGIGPSQAAQIAQERHGGKVLKVSRDGQSYRVKLLLPSGTVRTVRIDASGN
jgi:hypothetical protein